jgi:RecA-family ATPase
MQSYNNIDVIWPDIVNPLDQELKPIDFVIKGYSAKGLVTVIGGAGGSGKSLLNQYLLQKRNDEVLEVNKKQYALYLTGADTSDSELNRRAHNIGENAGLLGLSIPENGLPFICDHKFFKSLKKKISEFSVDAVIFDTLADFHHGNLIEAKDANETMQAFRSLASQSNVAVIIITHTRKGSKVKNRYDVEDISDSRIFTTKADFVFGLKSEYKNDSFNLIELQCLKNRSSKPISDIRLKIIEDPNDKKIYIRRTGELFEHEEANNYKVKEKREETNKVVNLSKQGKSYREIEKATGISKSKVGNIVKNNSF